MLISVCVHDSISRPTLTVRVL